MDTCMILHVFHKKNHIINWSSIHTRVNQQTLVLKREFILSKLGCSYKCQQGNFVNNNIF